MNIIGIICEYNPFHNGHLYHINKIKEMYPNSLIVLVMSSSFTQRGNASIINKWDKTKIALEFGIDLVIELPYPFTVQSANFFAKGALSILNHLKIDTLIFGSECNNIDELEITNNDKLLPSNDILARSYINEIKKNNYLITPLSIKRTNDYNSKELNNTITSATSIREALKKGIDVTPYIPINSNYLNNNFLDDNYFKYLQYKIISEKLELKKYLDVDEGLENRILKYIYEAETFDELIMKIKTKRYTYTKLSRMFNHILCDFTKSLRDSFEEITYLRILGFSNKGQKYLNLIKKDIKIPIVTNYKNTSDVMLKYEMKITEIYAIVLDNKERKKLIEAEYKNSPIRL